MGPCLFVLVLRPRGHNPRWPGLAYLPRLTPPLPTSLAAMPACCVKAALWVHQGSCRVKSFIMFMRSYLNRPQMMLLICRTGRHHHSTAFDCAPNDKSSPPSLPILTYHRGPESNRPTSACSYRAAPLQCRSMLYAILPSALFCF